MVAFYRALGLEVTEAPLLVQVHLGSQMINFHRPELLLVGFKLRAPAATVPCGDVCLVWDGTPEALDDLLAAAGAEVVEGPVSARAVGARPGRASTSGTRTATCSSSSPIRRRIGRGGVTPRHGDTTDVLRAWLPRGDRQCSADRVVVRDRPGT